MWSDQPTTRGVLCRDAPLRKDVRMGSATASLSTLVLAEVSKEVCSSTTCRRLRSYLNLTVPVLQAARDNSSCWRHCNLQRCRLAANGGCRAGFGRIFAVAVAVDTRCTVENRPADCGHLATHWTSQAVPAVAASGSISRVHRSRV